jgi:cobyrinic acid a,c-diamide synthase
VPPTKGSDPIMSDVRASPKQTLCARLVIAGTSSDVGTSTITTGILAALSARGRHVASAKVGPDYVSPGYHRVATGRPGRNLDVRISGANMIPRLALRAAGGADIFIIEGTGGLFDGVGTTNEASTAEVASLLDAPVVLVVDASKMSGSVAAVVNGFNEMFHKTFGSELVGIILNRVGSDAHEALLKEALGETRVRVLGAFQRSEEMNWPDLRSGLVPLVEHLSVVERSVKVLAELAASRVDIRGLEILADRAPQLRAVPPEVAQIVTSSRIPIAVPGGSGCGFAYQDNLDQLEAAGAKLAFFDPRATSSLPRGVKGLYAAGGLPEEYVKEIAANVPLMEDVNARVTGGLVTWAESGGFLWLCRSLDDQALCGVIAADASMTDHVTVGYRTVTLRNRCPIAPAHAVMVAYEQHASVMLPTGSALRLSGDGISSKAGWATPTMFASYLQLHLGVDPSKAEWFVAAAGGVPAPPLRERPPIVEVEERGDAPRASRPLGQKRGNGNSRRRSGGSSPSDRNRRGGADGLKDERGRQSPRRAGAGHESGRDAGQPRLPRPPRADGSGEKENTKRRRRHRPPGSERTDPKPEDPDTRSS